MSQDPVRNAERGIISSAIELASATAHGFSEEGKKRIVGQIVSWTITLMEESYRKELRRRSPKRRPVRRKK